MLQLNQRDRVEKVVSSDTILILKKYFDSKTKHFLAFHRPKIDFFIIDNNIPDYFHACNKFIFNRHVLEIYPKFSAANDSKS